MKTKYYTNLNTNAITASATLAKQWHTHGDNIAVTIHDETGKTIKSVFVKGAKVKTEHEKRDRENWEHCKHVSDELDCYVGGKYYTCPECGETVYIPDTVGDKFKCYHCGTVDDVDRYDTLTLCDYFNDVYDIEFTIGSDKSFRGVSVMVACGGHNIYIDTNTETVRLHWWTDNAHYYMRHDTVDAVNNWAEEYYNCI